MVDQEINIVSQIKNKFSTVSLRSDGIIEVYLVPEKDFTIENAREISAAIFQLGNGKKFPLMIVAGEYTAPTPETRNFVADERSNKYILAEAYVIKTLSQKIIGNFYLEYNKPARPTKLFDSKEKAASWLKQYIEHD